MVATLPIIPGGQLPSRPDVGSRTNAHQQAVFLTQAPGGGNRLFVGNLHDLVHQRKIENVRDKTIANALNLVQARLMPQNGRNIPGFDRDYFYFGVLFFEKLTHTLQGSTASYPQPQNTSSYLPFVAIIRAL